MTEPSALQQPSGLPRDPIVAAFMAIMAEKRFEDIGFAEIARRAGVSLSELRGKHASKIEMLAAYMRDVDRAVLDGIDEGLADEPPRERLFDVLMRRLDIMAPDKAAVKSLWQSARFNPGLTLAVNGLATRSMQWMLTAADISATGPKGMMRAQGLTWLFGSVMNSWADDNDPGQAKTLAALDRALSSGQRWAGLLDDLFRIPEAACNATRLFDRRRRRDEDRRGESAAA
ncbi:MAG: TetR/AcrR family transcriptional regulator [Xanthobacteraceae bacterium]|nr:TetR/AcrR family transcriptional regulator [Xanthobacteraceae bacterium]